ncbi:MAG: hypothetical protein CMH22_05215 [Methylophaga sp.]|nr:hypothetical protein [Methylophaga sp.]MAX51357.1 hypothetical protein [Methylophaga sp.]|tara:strand:- start:16901 stop:17695 length:795 start_codon:yes stop_codon:yes gene_type:complete
MGRPSKIKEGDFLELKNGFVEVLKYVDYKNILVKPITNEVIAEDVPYWTMNCNLKYKWSTTPFDRTLYGVGYRGVGQHDCKKSTKVHNTWANMLKRCYCESVWETDPGYRHVSVDTSWHNFQNFAEWFDQNYVEGFFLDKDLIGNSQLYSEATCCFIPNEVNIAIAMTHNQRKMREHDNLPTGVHYCKQTGKYSASCGTRQNSEWGGRHEKIEDAFEKYLEMKQRQLENLAHNFRSQITDVAYDALINFTEKRIASKYEHWRKR